MDEPAKKKRRMIEENDSITNKYDAILNKMRTSEKNLSPILGDDLLSESPLVEVYVGKFISKSKIGNVVLSLKDILPIPDFQHLKRVRNMEILLCSTDILENDLKNKLKEKEFDWESNLEDEIRLVSVPSKPPLTRSQYEVAHKMWPCNFHANKYTESLISGNFFTKEEISRHRTYMAIAYDVGLTIKKLTTSEQENFVLDDVKGVVIVDPKINSIVAVGHDRRNLNPCQHQVMVAIDNVAKTQNGGAWSTDDEFLKHSKSSLTETKGIELDCRGIPDIFRDVIRKNYPDVKTGARSYRKKGESNPDDPDDDCGPYLCTDYYIYTTVEPCAMCAMGLVHARAKRVFFSKSNKELGVLGSKCKLHTVSGLNHRYEVYTGFFE